MCVCVCVCVCISDMIHHIRTNADAYTHYCLWIYIKKCS